MKRWVLGLFLVISFFAKGQVDFISDCDTVFSFDTYGRVGLTFDGSYLYTRSTSGLGYTYKYDLSGNLQTYFVQPWNIEGGDIDHDGTNLWAIAEQQAKLYKITTSGNVLLTYNLPTHDADPDYYGCAYDNGFVWVSEYGDRTLLRINAINGAIVDSFVTNRRLGILKIIDGELYGIEADSVVWGRRILFHFNKTTGAIIDSMLWCLNSSLGMCKANGDIWGLGIETQKIYRFNNFPLSIGVNNQDANFQIYPNPATSSFTINSKGDLKIYDVMGKEVYSATLNSKQETVNCKLQAGLYFVRVGERTQKLVIE